ncbi:MAG TPA: type II toxin-antitoxin system CcdA family antitoxin [Ignavibacteriales bacterium]|nr:type II toxin-antitoxin system CcdA family antitoxin [Ignavibacteriales bacterium]
MNNAATENLRKNFLLPADMVEKAESMARELNINLSQMVRAALDEYMKKIEEKKTEQEVIEACQFYYELDKQTAREWKSAEAKI